MTMLRQSPPSQAAAARAAQRLRPKLHSLIATLVIALTLFSPAAAQSDGDCDAPDKLTAHAESLSAQWKASAMREALGEFKRACVCWNRAGLWQQEASALKRIGDIHLSLSDYEPAVESYNAALSRSKEIGDPQLNARALVDLGRALLFTLRLDEALQNLQEAASIARTLGDSGLEASAGNAIGKYYYKRGDYQKAAEHYAQALPLAQAAGNTVEEAQALYNIGQIHSDIGELQEALNHYQRALVLWQAAKQRQGEVRTLTSIGLTYSLMGESQTALEYLDGKALPSLREAGDRRGEAAAQNNIGCVYQSLGDNEAALSHYRDALAIFDQIKVPSGQAISSVYVGDVSALLGKMSEAQESYERALKLGRALENPLLEAEVLNSMGTLLVSAGKADEAYELFRQALSAYEKRPSLRGQAVVLNNIGWYFGGRSDWHAAAIQFRRALEFCRAAGDQFGESLTLYNIARSELELGDYVAARANVEAGLRLTETLRTKVAGGELRASYFATAHRQFELFIAVLMRLHKSNNDSALVVTAFEASERGRARSLLETLAEAHADIRRGVNPEFLRRERELQLQLNAKAERRVQLLGGKASAKEVAEIERQIDELTAEYHRVQGQIRVSSPRYAALVQPAPLSLKETQQKVLDEDTLLLEYAIGEEHSFLWAVTPDSIKSFELPARAEIEKASRRVYDLLTARNQRGKDETGQQWQARVRQAEGEYADASAALGRILLGPVASELGRKRLVIVADGALQYVSFGALPVPDRAIGEKRRPDEARARGAAEPSSIAASSNTQAEFIPLVYEHEIVSLPSASVLAVMREEFYGRRSAPKSVAILADPVFNSDDERIVLAKTGGVQRRDSAIALRGSVSDSGAQRPLRDLDGLSSGEGIAPLPFSRREAKAIMDLVPTDDGMLALGFQASRATATGPELSQYRIVHFATHGLLDSEHPELSGVVLSLFDKDGRRQDGFLQLHEIYNLNLSADLVVLSACQTALGKEVKGEGLIGLTRGFMYAGAPRVVASLWKVDDHATAELMGEFYRQMLGKGLRPAAALRAAQVHIWQQPRWHSPYYWAAFTLQGEWK